MFIEICKHCKPMRPFVRMFDVTERTNKNKHTTFRRCYVCGNSLYDTIVHFGEKGTLKWPINWQGATKAADKADVILCIGSSLKVLRRYSWLWHVGVPKRQRPKLFIVNLQWTPKDSSADVKINGKCDDVMRRVMEQLQIKVPEYWKENDPLLSITTKLNPHEAHTTTRTDLILRVKKEEPDPEEDDPGGEQPNNIKVGVEEVIKKEKIKEEPVDLKTEVKEEKVDVKEVLQKIALDALAKDHCYASPEKKAAEPTNTPTAPHPTPTPNPIATPNPTPSPAPVDTSADNSEPPVKRNRTRQCREKEREKQKLLKLQQQQETEAKAAAQQQANKKGKFVKSGVLDYKTIVWPRDALYLPYQSEFEFIKPSDVIGEDAFCCDCCDPAKKRGRRKKRRGSQSDCSSDDEDEEEDDSDDQGDEEEDDGDKTDGKAEMSDSESTSSSSTTATTATNGSGSKPTTPAPTVTNQPGWFGKGRTTKKKKDRFC